MALLQPRLNLKVAQKQVLTPGLVQMVSLLALNKQELKEMIDAEILENPVLEELEESVPLIDDVRTPEEAAPPAEEKKEDPFDEIDFGSYFQDYLDPGYRTPESSEISERPSFENFLSKSTTLTDHLMWQLGSIHVEEAVRQAAELVIGNLNEDGYLTASDDELLEALLHDRTTGVLAQMPARPDATAHAAQNGHGAIALAASAEEDATEEPAKAAIATPQAPPAVRRALQQALELVRGFDPAGIGARDLRECLLVQLNARASELARIAAVADTPPQAAPEEMEQEAASGETILALARRIIDEFLMHLLKRDLRELTRLTASRQPTAQAAIELIRSLDPKPGQRYNREQPRLIEPDVAFVKRDEEFVILINDEEIPTLRLNHGYRRMLSQEGTEREVRDYVKERYRSAIQLMRNIEQRKNTILRTCEVIVRRQRDFLEQGVDALRPMMIKEVAEEIGVHASTVSRAVANKYAHTPQGVFELRFFFSEGVNGPEGADTPLLLLKRKVKKMIEEEDSSKPLTDDSIASLLQAQGIAVNRRTVAKYREDLGIPSTHQRRVRI